MNEVHPSDTPASPPHPVKLREALPGDLDALVALSRKTFTDKFGHLYRPEDLQAYLDEAHSQEFYREAITSPDYHVRVAETPNGSLGAYLVCSPLELPVEDPAPRAVELMRVYVDGPLQGRGLGTGFIQEGLDWARNQQAPELYLSVFSENEGAFRLYERLGFEKVREFWFPVGDHRDLEYLMRFRF